MSSYKINSLGNLELKSRNGSILHKSAVEHEQSVTFSHADDAHLASLKSLSLANEDLLMHNGTSLNKVSKNDLLSGLASESYVDSAVAGVAPLITSVDLPLSVNSGVLSVELGDLLSQSLAETTYLSQADAQTTYLSQADASTTYLAQADQFITSIVEPSQLSVVDGVLNVNLDDYVSSSSLSTTLNDYATTAFVGTEVETAVDGLASIAYVDDQIANVSSYVDVQIANVSAGGFISSVGSNLDVTSGELTLGSNVVVKNNGDIDVARISFNGGAYFAPNATTGMIEYNNNYLIHSASNYADAQMKSYSVFNNFDTVGGKKTSTYYAVVTSTTANNKEVSGTNYVALEIPFSNKSHVKVQLQGNVEVGGVGSDLVGTYSHERFYNLSGFAPNPVVGSDSSNYTGSEYISDLFGGFAHESSKLFVLINKAGINFSNGSVSMKVEVNEF